MSAASIRQPVILVVVVASLMASHHAAAQNPSMPDRPNDALILPDPKLTPGAADPAVSETDICNGAAGVRRADTRALCAQVFAAYAIPAADRTRYTCTHLVPLSLGGADVAANLWPQSVPQAQQKAALDAELQRQVCQGDILLPRARREITTDWGRAYRRYIVGQ